MGGLDADKAPEGSAPDGKSNVDPAAHAQSPFVKDWLVRHRWKDSPNGHADSYSGAELIQEALLLPTAQRNEVMAELHRMYGNTCGDGRRLERQRNDVRASRDRLGLDEQAEGTAVIDRVLKFPGNSEKLYRNFEDAEFVAAMRAALDAVDILRPAWEPLSAEAEVYGLTSTDPIEAELVETSQPHWLLVRTPVPAGVRIASLWKDPVIRETPSLARGDIEAWLADALGQVSSPAHGEWSELRFHAGRAWAGPPGWRSGEDELRLHHEAGTVVVPVERNAHGAWLSGPREPAFDQPPIDVRFNQEVGSVTLTITRNYGNWIDASPATERLNERLAALRRAGWASTV